MQNDTNTLVWIDLETTGVNINTDVILEAAVFVTDLQLNLLEPNGFSVVVHHAQDNIMKLMSDYVLQMHTDNKLLEEVLASQVSIEEAENQILEYLRTYTNDNDSLLCGTNIPFDRAFLMRYMRTVEEFLSHKCLDVTSVKELIKIHAPDKLKNSPSFQSDHRAKADILESIERLKLYRDALFY